MSMMKYKKDRHKQKEKGISKESEEVGLKMDQKKKSENHV